MEKGLQLFGRSPFAYSSLLILVCLFCCLGALFFDNRDALAV